MNTSAIGELGMQSWPQWQNAVLALLRADRALERDF
jgi:hypothetical protein